MISEYAVVKTKKIGNEVSIGEFSVIEEDVVIGNNVVIHPNVVISSGVVIKDGVEIFPGALIGKEPKGAGALARTPIFERKVLIGANSSISPNAVIYYDVEIGEQTLIGDGASIREQCKIGSNCIISRYVTINYNTIIGDRTKIMDLTHITGNCIIGNDVFISVNVGTVNDNKIGKEGYSERVLGPVIEDGASIGAGATLLQKVVIGKNSIVSANSLVRKDVKENSLVMGNPAKPFRRINIWLNRTTKL